MLDRFVTARWLIRCFESIVRRRVEEGVEGLRHPPECLEVRDAAGQAAGDHAELERLRDEREIEVLDVDARVHARELPERLAEAQVLHHDAAIEDRSLEVAVERHDALPELQARNAAGELSLELGPAKCA